MGYFVDTFIKVEKAVDHHSLLKTKKNVPLQKEKPAYLDELNKKKVYLLVNQKSIAKKGNQLLVIEPENRFNTEKRLVNRRHKSFLIRMRATKKREQQKPTKEKQEDQSKRAILTRHRSAIKQKLKKRQTKRQTEKKIFKLLRKERVIEKEKVLHFLKYYERAKKERDKYFRYLLKPNLNLEENLVSESKWNEPIPLFFPRFLTRSFSSKNKQESPKVHYYRNNQSYYADKKTKPKPICPVFFDRSSAEEFLVQNSTPTLLEKALDKKRSILELYQELLKLEETSIHSAQKVLVKIEDLQKKQLELLEKPKNNKRLNFSLLKKSIFQKANSYLLSFQEKKFNAYKKAYQSERKLREASFKNYEETFASFQPRIKPYLFVLKKKVDSPSVKEMKKLMPKQLQDSKKAQVISIGLGDLLEFYSSSSKQTNFNQLEFLFFPETKEISDNKKQLLSLFGKNTESNHQREPESTKRFDLPLSKKTFKDYQRNYFKKI